MISIILIISTVACTLSAVLFYVLKRMYLLREQQYARLQELHPGHWLTPAWNRRMHVARAAERLASQAGAIAVGIASVLIGTFFYRL